MATAASSTTEASLPRWSVSPSTSTGSERLRGTLVHRLLQRLGAVPSPISSEPDRIAQLAAQLISPEENDEVDDVFSLCTDAAEMYGRLIARADVRDLYGRGDAFHEVPFCRTVDGSVVRGTIDLLVRWSDPASGASRATILEFKTGRPAPEHTVQAMTYRDAVEALFPGDSVETRLVYVDDSDWP
jgi:hypothetical protein